VTISKSLSKARAANTNLEKFVSATNQLLAKASAQFSPTSAVLTADQKKRMPKLRKGADSILPKLGALLQKHGVDGAGISVAQMLGDLQRGQTLVPLQQGLTSLLKQVEDEIFSSNAASVKTASYGYASLQRMARDDGDLAANLEPISSFFAYRHPSVKEEKAPKPQRTAQANLKKATSRIAAQVERAQKTILHASGSSTAASTNGAPVAASAVDASPAQQVVASAPPAVTTAPAAATTVVPAMTVAPTH
jgi:hypothetical protein